MIITRDFYLKKLIDRIGNKQVKVITGIKGVGKSFLLNELFYQYLINELKVAPKQIIKINLDSIYSLKYRNPIFLSEYINSRLLSDCQNFIFIDEIQYVEQILNPYLDNDYIGFYEVLNEFLNKHNVDIYVTGSNSRMLSKDVLTQFRGRGDLVLVMPLTIFELKQTFNLPFEELYASYQIYGGLPYIFTLNSNQDKEDYLKKLLKETYLIDVIAKNAIRSVDKLDNLTNILASSIGCYTSASKIEKTFKSTLAVIYD